HKHIIHTKPGSSYAHVTNSFSCSHFPDGLASRAGPGLETCRRQDHNSMGGTDRCIENAAPRIPPPANGARKLVEPQWSVGLHHSACVRLHAFVLSGEDTCAVCCRVGAIRCR